MDQVPDPEPNSNAAIENNSFICKVDVAILPIIQDSNKIY